MYNQVSLREELKYLNLDKKFINYKIKYFILNTLKFKTGWVF